MRYIPETDRAISLEALAAEGRNAIQAAGQPINPPVLLQAWDVFTAESLPIWYRGIRQAHMARDVRRVDRLQFRIGRDLHDAMHHRAHQPLI